MNSKLWRAIAKPDPASVDRLPHGNTPPRSLIHAVATHVSLTPPAAHSSPTLTGCTRVLVDAAVSTGSGKTALSLNKLFQKSLRCRRTCRISSEEKLPKTSRHTMQFEHLLHSPPPQLDLQGVRQFLNVQLAIFSRIVLREGLSNCLYTSTRISTLLCPYPHTHTWVANKAPAECAPLALCLLSGGTISR